MTSSTTWIKLNERKPENEDYDESEIRNFYAVKNFDSRRKTSNEYFVFLFFFFAVCVPTKLQYPHICNGIQNLIQSQQQQQQNITRWQQRHHSALGSVAFIVPLGRIHSGKTDAPQNSCTVPYRNSLKLWIIYVSHQHFMGSLNTLVKGTRELS